MQSEKSKILIVDDSPEILELAKISLEHKGFDVSPCDNGFDALKAFERSLSERCRFEASLIDCAMPGMDGLTLALRIRQMEKERGLVMGERTRLIFFTGHHDLQLSEQVQGDLGIYKTVRKIELVELIQEIAQTIPTTCTER